MKYLVFNSEQAANTAAEDIYINALAEIANEHNNEIIINEQTKTKANFSSLTRQEKLNLKIFSYRKGRKRYDGGFVTAIVSIIKAYNKDKWYCKKPINVEWLNGVSGYEEINNIPEDWTEPHYASSISEEEALELGLIKYNK